ncbi:MAG: bifunctional glutamate N-acetyltransferase/amino-acid acetyltransferase ArgJ [Firmicutes bacterium]|jgi:glutamate N-acetyltransferase/amino-acid N-acetyltransferase|nr:bifunctional glutamate N-acetyltransferase/amino-acid acetyltransferase ArgJ [Bacillota bacterium]HPU01268.1 bifunctional glutamate N-acetyltransferase/amino-acid acetyltransferase ArgJ [Bacillota bacterium]
MSEKLAYRKIENAGITLVQGIQAAAVHCGLKKRKLDLALVYSSRDCAAAGVFTRNRVQAAPVRLCRKAIAGPIRALVVNSGNANACTGEAGMQNARRMAALAAASLGLSPAQVLVCSTGVIGQQLPMELVERGIARAAEALSGERKAGRAAARAILTTDTVAKEVAYRGTYGGATFHLAGMAKGSGMICPDMATMLAFLFTDLAIPRPLLQRLFREAVDRSFNLITVDGDTSTNDTALILANGAAGAPEITPGSEACRAFAELLEEACRDLAYQIVADGEGVTKVITLTLQGAPDPLSARILARAVLNSPLVKTAFYGEDANWGRILAALGYAGVDFDPSRVDIYLGPVQVAAGGEAVPFSESEARAVLQQKEVPVLVRLNAGSCSLTAWGSDLSHNYVTINSSYRS